MKKRLYPAVLERGPKATFGAWFPDFPGCVAAGKSQEQAIERAENALAQAVDELFERGQPLPQPTPIERIVLPKGCDHPAYFIVGVDPPDPSERVNVYLPKSLIGQIDRRAAELGRSEEHTSELQSHVNLVCRLLLEKKNIAVRNKRFRQTYIPRT